MIEIVCGLVNGQVLQRHPECGATVSLSLSGSESAPVLCSIGNAKGFLKSWKARRIGVATAGKTILTLANIPVGGPYRLEISCGKFTTSIAGFYVGDVWLLAGQSNMEGYGNLTGAAKPHPLIRAFSMRREWRAARDPLHICMESPDACHSAGRPLSREQAEAERRTRSHGVGPGVFFAREMLALSGVPQGLICTAHGGTTMTQWDPARKDRDSLYGSMLASVRATGQPVAGMLWYQGESDSNEEDHIAYSRRVKALVAALRRDLRQPALPWMMCQSARAFNRDKQFSHWNSIQDQQRRLPGLIRHLEVVSTIDLPMDDPVHIGSAGHQLLARRLADVAARLVYRAPKRIPTPRLRRIRSISTGATQQIEVLYENVQGGLTASADPQGFTLLDANANPMPFIFKTTLAGNAAILHLANCPPDGATLAYGHGHTPICNIVDGRGQALPVFTSQRILRDAAWLPFLISWRTSDILPGLSLAAFTVKDLASRRTSRKTYEASGFVNEHSQWENHSGLGFFVSSIHLPEAMVLEAYLGYDGPIRMWIDEQPFFADLAGTNPCVPDQSRKKIRLSKGRHSLCVAMDLNDGSAWGFYLRFKRCDVPRARIASGEFAKPDYSAELIRRHSPKNNPKPHL